MLSAIDLSSARDLIRWAREDIDEFDAGSQTYFAGQPYKMFTEPDPETGHAFLKVSISPVPDRLRKLAGHALWDLKHALDHATYAAILAVTGAPPKLDTYFPWASHPNDLTSKLTHYSGKYPPVLHDLFRSFEPYPTGNAYSGGDDNFVALNKMANTSKHTVTLNPCPRIGLHEFKGSGGLVCIYQDRWDRQKQQFTVGLVRVGAEVKANLQFAGFVEFGEIEIFQNHPAGMVLDAFCAGVSDVVGEIESEVSAIIAHGRTP